MHIAALWVYNFRAIHELSWFPNQGVNCLIGPGDSCKTTILDAIDLLLAERQNVNFDDLDFYDANPTNAIRIVAVIAQLPQDYLREDRYGMLLAGWNAVKLEWKSEPAENAGIAPALILQLDVDDILRVQGGGIDAKPAESRAPDPPASGVFKENEQSR